MKYKKAQIGSTITWFMGFLVIIFILFLFIAMSFSNVAVQRVSQGKPNLTAGENTEFHKSEQQRQLFVFFEEEFEEKTNYEIVNHFSKELERNKKMKENEAEYQLLDSMVSENMVGSRTFCQAIIILDKKSQERYSRAISSDKSYTYHYYYLPNKELELDKKNNQILQTYSFFFAEKPFALIKYIPTRCPKIEKLEIKTDSGDGTIVLEGQGLGGRELQLKDILEIVEGTNFDPNNDLEEDTLIYSTYVESENYIVLNQRDPETRYNAFMPVGAIYPDRTIWISPKIRSKNFDSERYILDYESYNAQSIFSMPLYWENKPERTENVNYLRYVQPSINYGSGQILAIPIFKTNENIDFEQIKQGLTKK